MFEFLIITIVFSALLANHLLRRTDRKLLLGRSLDDWVIDSISLGVQGILIPLAQVWLSAKALGYLLPQLQGSLSLNPIFAFGVSFILVDYAYYWNHRFLHHKKLWWLHHIHHATPRFDILITSRNTVYTPIVIVYVWLHSLFFFLLQDPTYYMVGVTLTSCLDLWRHSSLDLPQGLTKILEPIFITPKTHRWHHSSHHFNTNFGANFTLWDRLHGTYQVASKEPQKIGLLAPFSLWRKLFFPFRA